MISPHKEPHSRHYEVDAEIGGAILVEVKQGVDSLRALSGAMLHMAYALENRPGCHGYLVLADSRISMERLKAEWTQLTKVLRPAINKRMGVCLETSDGIRGLPSDPDENTQQKLKGIVDSERKAAKRARGGRLSHSTYDILRILINQWIRNAGALTSRSIADMAGCSYPTVASALKKLDRYLVRHSDRRVELTTFPKDDWFRLVANSDDVRQTLRLADRSDQPRSIESLVDRLKRARPAGVAIGGTIGARRLNPSLDLVGNPRLDLTIHCLTKEPDLAFLRKLDPALQPVNEGEVPRLAIHLVRRAENFFEQDPDGMLYADPVECLLDLHEMRFESQAQEWIRSLSANKEKTR